MKRIILLYLGAFLLCLIAGVIASLGRHCSWPYYLLILFLLPIGWVVMHDVFLRINEKNLGKVTVLTVVVFFVMLGLMMLGAYRRIDAKSFWGMVYAVGVVSYTIGIIAIGLTLPKRWEERKKKEGRYLYWE